MMLVCDSFCLSMLVCSMWIALLVTSLINFDISFAPQAFLRMAQRMHSEILGYLTGFESHMGVIVLFFCVRLYLVLQLLLCSLSCCIPLLVLLQTRALGWPHDVSYPDFPTLTRA